MSETAQVRRGLGFLLQETSRLMRRRFVQRAREAGLKVNRSEASVLVHVFHSPGISQATLANYLDIETISVVRLIDSLQAAGLIERRPHPTDRRIRTLWLTEAAATTVSQIQAIGRQVRAQALAGVPEEEHEYLFDLLSVVRTNLEASGEPMPCAAEAEAAG
ncbi:MAG TPA: MarR family transcriptional regulator [Acetobacteraceae bacterium]|jgi:DNA-binding MarR family transcriptional regulator|nr:MarR family transcriptional regulator [Acetobacteraceae bacterium]